MWVGWGWMQWISRKEQKERAGFGSQMNFLNQILFHCHPLLENLVPLRYSTWILNLKIKVNYIEGNPEEQSWPHCLVLSLTSGQTAVPSIKTIKNSKIQKEILLTQASYLGLLAYHNQTQQKYSMTAINNSTCSVLVLFFWLYDQTVDFYVLMFII